MWPTSDADDAGSDPAPYGRRRPSRWALAIALAVHALLAIVILRWHLVAPAPRMGGNGIALVTVQLPGPKPPPPPPARPKPAPAGVKLAAHPSPGVPAAKTIERQLATLPQTEIEPEATQPAVADPLPNLAAIDVAASAAGTGGAGRSGTGAGAGGVGAGGAGKLFGECADTPERAMVADVYRLPNESDSVRAMEGRKALKRVCIAQLDVTPRSFREGFPGLDGLIEWFGLDIRFTVNVPEAGAWDLVLQSDDGAILTIDGVQVIDNDGRHKPVAQLARVRLAAGPRRFRVRYFQGPREAIALQLLWKKPGEKDFSYIPPGLMGRQAP